MGAGHAHTLYHHGHSRVHRLAPEVKVAAAFLFAVGVALTPREAVWAFAVDAVTLGTVIAVARLPLRFVLVRLLVIVPFVIVALIVPFIAQGDQVEVLGLSLSREGLWGTFNIVAKAGLGATVSIILAGTTEAPRILRGLQRLKVPPVLTMIATFMLRYLELIAGELGRMRTAMTARGYDPRWLWQTRPLATAAGALFIRSYERGERIHAAMLARGYNGVMPDLEPTRADASDWAVAATVPAVAAIAAVAGLVTVA